MNNRHVMEEPEDEIVREVDVFLSSELSQLLQLFQYPVKAEPFGPDSLPIECRFKPKAKLIEMDVPIDSNLATYNQYRGAELAIGLDDKPLKTADRPFSDSREEQKMFDRQTLASKVLPVYTNYFVGAIKEGGLHLTKVKGVVQLRPSFKAIDKIDAKTVAANKRPEKPVESEKNVPQAIQIQIKKQAGSTYEEPKRTIAEQVRDVAEESFRKIDYNGMESSDSYIHSECLYSKTFSPLLCKQDRHQYLSNLSANLTKEIEEAMN